MKSLGFGRYALTSCVAAAMLGGCGGSPSSVNDILPVNTRDSYAFPARKSNAYLYVYEYGAGEITALSYPGGRLIRSVRGTGFLCTDPNNGNLYVSSGSRIFEYSPGVAQQINDVALPMDYTGLGCAVDPSSGQLAVAGAKNGSPTKAVVLIYSRLTELAKIVTDSSQRYFMFDGYDNAGNLFVDTYTSLEELPHGQKSFTHISGIKVIIGAGTVQWDGNYITIESSERRPTIFRVSISGSVGTIVGTTRLGDRRGREHVYSWIDGNNVIAAWGRSSKNAKLGFWDYPNGGKTPNHILAGFKYVYSLVVGIK